jgi:sporulation protein YlmC with PRC-barrel domain
MSATDQVGMVALSDSSLVLANPEDDVRGMVVVDPSGHRLGQVEDLVIDEHHRRVRLLVVASGGILGLGRTERLVPVEAVTRVGEKIHVAPGHGLPTAAESLASADLAYDPEVTDPPPYTAVYGLYGYPPFWAPGHVTAYFHDR